MQNVKGIDEDNTKAVVYYSRKNRKRVCEFFGL